MTKPAAEIRGMSAVITQIVKNEKRITPESRANIMRALDTLNGVADELENQPKPTDAIRWSPA